jgi:hypothetical protein
MINPHYQRRTSWLTERAFCTFICSFFGQQDGDFCLVVKAIQAATRTEAASQPVLDKPQRSGEGESDGDEDEDFQKPTGATVSGFGRRSSGTATRGSPRWRGVFCGLL